MCRLVLGCGAVGRDIVASLADRPGKLHVVTDDSGRATALREENVDALEADPTDPSTYPDRAEMIVVAGDVATRNLTVADRARSAFPDAFILSYAGDDADEADLQALAELSDHVIDPIQVATDRVLAAARDEPAERMWNLLRALRGVEGTLAVVAHDNPDPDAIASAIALVRIAEFAGIEAEACYYGEISHQENRALVNLLELDMRKLDPEDDPRETYDAFALVDHSRPGINDGLPGDVRPTIVVDHHPPRVPVEAEFIDVRSDVGATSTLLAEYLDRFGLEPDEQVATALLYGIRVDTKDFTRETARADFDAAEFLLPYTDQDVLSRVEEPSVSSEVLDVIARAIRNRETRGETVASCVGELSDRDALAQAAEQLLDMEGVTTTLVYGFSEGTVYVSGRTRGADLDLGETLRDALGQIGSAGGHADMAGAQVPLGILAEVEKDEAESVAEIVRDVIAGRFFETLADAPSAPTHDTERSVSFPEEDD